MAGPFPRRWLTAMLLCAAAGLVAAQAPAPQPVGTQAAHPRIGLVLSGGGARGSAHVGVLKLLDELRVPVSAIAGTSMGAVVGGLYASGMSGRDIEQLLSTVDWQDAFRDRVKRTELSFRRKREDEDFLVNLPLGVRGKRLLLPAGLIAGQKLTQILRQATLPVAAVNDFDRLRVPLRVVATDLETGAAVIIGDGDLPTAMRASMSAPGVFAPVERNGRLLVDGGLVKNLPIDVARAMGVDVLIVVDAGVGLREREQLNSLTSVSNQAVAIMVRRDADAQRATLGPADVFLQPAMDELSAFDFSRIASAVAAGAAAAEAARPALARLGVTEAEYRQWLARDAGAPAANPEVRFVRTDAASLDYQPTVRNVFAGVIGKPFDAAAVAKGITGLYARGTFEFVDYRLVGDAGLGTGLEFSARRNSWGPNYLRLGLSLQDDFAGATSFNAAARVLYTELGPTAAEWIFDLQVGDSPRLASELYLPLSSRRRYFVAPHVQFEAHNVPQLAASRQIGEYRVRSFEYGLDAGREFSNWGELRAGLLRTEGVTRVRVGDFSVPDARFGVNAGFLRFGYDRLDSANFPRSGQSLRIEYRLEADGRTTAGSDVVTADWRGAWSRGKNTLVGWVSGGSTVGGSEMNARTYFPLGGFLNLSGLRFQSLAGPHYAVARAIYLHKVGSGGEGVLNVPAYAGISLELGNAWARRSAISVDGARRNAAIFFGADTYIGPAYLAAGYDDSGASAFYLFLGRSF